MRACRCELSTQVNTSNHFNTLGGRHFAMKGGIIRAHRHSGPGPSGFGHSGPGHPGPRTSRSFGHPGPRTSRSPDIQVFWTSRSFGLPGPRTSRSPDIQVFWTSRSFGRPGLSDVQVFRTTLNCWQHISNTNIHSPILCPKGTQKPSNLHSSPKCWHDISNTNICPKELDVQKTWMSKRAGCPKDLSVRGAECPGT